MSDSTFADFGLAAPLLTALARLEIVTPTPVQVQSIPMLMEGRDLIASAPTGTGKTAAFMLPALHRIVSSEPKRGRGPRVLVLTPTRELAQQVSKATQGFSRTLPRMTTVCITGGESYMLQNKQLAAPYEVLVATPGRLIDQMNSGKIDFSRVDTFVLDEADRMLDMGFSDDVLMISRALPAERQTICFTATLTRGVRGLADQLLRNPHWMEVDQLSGEEVTIDEHVIYADNKEHRNRLLSACLNDTGLVQAIVFTATKRHAEELAGELIRDGISAQALHGDLNQRDRTRALNKLRRGECKVLVATDVAARGIDVATISHVINFELPKFAEDYVHRIGRTGRAGATGQALSFVGREDMFNLHKIEHFIGRKVQVSEIEGHEASFKPGDRKPQRPNSAGYRGKPSNYNKAGPRKPATRTGGNSTGTWNGPANGTSHAPRFGKATGNGGFGRSGAPARARG